MSNGGGAAGPGVAVRALPDCAPAVVQRGSDKLSRCGSGWPVPCRAPPAPVAALLSPVLWRLNAPDRFDMYSVGVVLLQVGRMGGGGGGKEGCPARCGG